MEIGVEAEDTPEKTVHVREQTRLMVRGPWGVWTVRCETLHVHVS